MVAKALVRLHAKSQKNDLTSQNNSISLNYRAKPFIKRWSNWPGLIECLEIQL